MATYTELNELSTNGVLINKIAAAIAVCAHDILNEATPSVPRKAWAEAAIINPVAKVPEMMWYLLADNATLTTAQFLSASDVSILAAVVEAVAKRVG